MISPHALEYKVEHIASQELIRTILGQGAPSFRNKNKIAKKRYTSTLARVRYSSLGRTSDAFDALVPRRAARLVAIDTHTKSPPTTTLDTEQLLQNPNLALPKKPNFSTLAGRTEAIQCRNVPAPRA